MPLHRNVAESAEFQQAQEWFKTSNRIGFLGFGFDKLNVSRLGIRDITDKFRASNMTLPIFYASAFQRTNAEKSLTFQTMLNASGQFVQIDGCSLVTLKETGILF